MQLESGLFQTDPGTTPATGHWMGSTHATRDQRQVAILSNASSSVPTTVFVQNLENLKSTRGKSGNSMTQMPEVLRSKSTLFPSNNPV